MKIKEWLNSNRNFDIGVALYQTFGTDLMLKKMFDQGWSTIREKRLFEELKALINVDVIYNQHVPKEPQNINVASARMPELLVSDKEDIYRSEWLPLYQEMNLLRHSLETIADVQERGSVAFRILSLEQSCMHIWSRRDYCLRTNSKIEDKDEEAEPFIDINILQKRINTVRTFISKYSKVPGTEKQKKLLLKYQNEMIILNKQLNNLS